MTRSVVIALAVLVLVVVVGELLGRRPATLELSTAAMPSLQELHAMADVRKLPRQDLEDQSLIYPKGTDPDTSPKP